MSRLFSGTPMWSALVVAVSMALFGGARDASAQVRWRDLVVTLGGSIEAYSGNFSAVTVPIVDNADHATAMVGEFGARGVLSLFQSQTRSLDLSFDAGMRQAAAYGFELRDYAPREWVGRASGRFTQTLGSWASLVLETGGRARSVRDRPPMPLFLQPGYASVDGSAGLVTRAFDGVSFDAKVDVERADYQALEFLPQLDLLDRTSTGLEFGARWGGTSGVRFYGGFRWTDYSNQGSFDPQDPFRRDHTAQVGLDWTYTGPLMAQVGLAGTVNRSNSNRPEYDALSLRAIVTAPLPQDVTVTLFGLLTGKSYVHDTDFTRLVPGEEADNASIAYLQFARSLSLNLDGAVRLGWTRAETDFGNAYYQRFGTSVQFNYRPRGF